MTETIDIGTIINLPDLLQSRLLIQGNSGAGKSGLARIIIEKTFGLVPFVVWDIEGEYYTLKELSGDILIIGGQHADVPITYMKDDKLQVYHEMAEKLPAMIIKNRLTVVVDISDLKMSGRIQFTKDFFETLMDLPMEYWTSYFFFLEECHKLAGEQDKQESSTAIKDLMQRGRKRGYCGIPITQRISMLNKSVAAECNNKFIGRTSLDNDIDRSGKELGFTTKSEDRLKLRELKRGHFFAYGTSIEPQHVHEVTVSMPQTTMLKVGMEGNYKPQKPTTKILAMMAELNKLPNSGEKKSPTKIVGPVSEKNLTGNNDAEITRLKNENLKLTDTINKKSTIEQDLRNKLRHATSIITNVYGIIDGVRSNIDSQLSEIKPMAPLSVTKSPEVMPEKERPVFVMDQISTKFSAPQHYHHDEDAMHPTNGPESSTSIPKGEETLLRCLASYGTLERKSLTVISGYTKSTRDTYILKLREKGLVESVSTGVVSITKEGIKRLGKKYRPLPKGRDLFNYWMNELPAGERAILHCVVDAYPNAISRQEISKITGYTKSTRDTYLLKMRHKQIIDTATTGMIIANKLLID